MAKQGEIDYLRNLGSKGRLDALDKPYRDPCCGTYFRDMGAIFDLLPLPPARVLDMGCGSGWTSIMFARRGYDVVGQDIAPDMIELAEENHGRFPLDNLRFVVCDYEELPFTEEFDAVVFNESLHHAIDEEAALRNAFRVLKPGGICIANEPGEGHAVADYSLHAVEKFDVTEKDMPPHRIMNLGMKVGFNAARVIRRMPVLETVFDTRTPPAASGRFAQVMQGLKHALRSLIRGVPPAPTLERPNGVICMSNLVVLHKPGPGAVQMASWRSNR